MTPQQQELLARHNAIRADHKLSPCQWHEGLGAAAQEHAADMAARGRLSHDGMSARATAHGWTGTALGENVAMGAGSVEEVFGDWLGSPGHRANILGQFDSAGYGVAPDKSGRLWWCGMFGLAGTPSDGTPSPPGGRRRWWQWLLGLFGR